MEKFLLIVLILCCVVLILAIGKEKADVPDTKSLWGKVKEAQSDGLPQTAIKYLKSIYDIAVQGKKDGEALRASIQKIVLESIISGNKPEDKVNRLQEQISKAPERLRPMMQVVLAQWYWHYYSRNRWRFLERSQTQGLNEKDFTTWDLPKLFSKISSLYQEIVKSEKLLKGISLDAFGDFLEKGSLPQELRPTLFDFVVFEALEFYSSGEQAKALPQDDFEIQAKSDALSRADDFLKYRLDQTFPDSPKFQALLLFQKVLQFHQKDRNPDAFTDADLHRLRYFRNVAFGEEKVSRFIKRLEEIINAYPESPLYSQACYLWAAELKSQEKRVQAREIARQGQHRFPRSPGGVNCTALISEIERKEFDLKTEKVVLPNHESNLVLEYKNLEILFFRLVPVDPDGMISGKEGRNFYQISEDFIGEMLKEKPAASWSLDLKPTPDYQKKKILVNLPRLKPGYYRIFASARQDFSQQPDNKIQHSPLWVSPMGLILRSRAGILEGYAVENQSGVAIPDATAAFYQYDYNCRAYLEKHRVKTDCQGYFSFAVSERHYGYVWLVSLSAPNMGTFVETSIPYSYHYPEVREGITLFFTDRALFRPGQMVHFKGICLKPDNRKDSFQLLTREKVTVSLRDVNEQEISRMERVTTDFGSFSGDFLLPADRLAGSWSLVALGPLGHAPIQVEEYKRPKFQVTLEIPEKEFRLNDRVELSGEALAYTGAPIDQAQLRFRVVREVQFPYWRHYGSIRPRAEAQEIAHGTALTDKKGRFVIAFPARPDQKIPRASNPVFSFKVQAEITDSSGETRGDEIHIRLGYQSIEARMGCPSWQEEGVPQALNIDTFTLNGKRAQAEGTIEIFRVEQPKNPIPADLIGETSASEPDARNATPDPKSRFKPEWETWPSGKQVMKKTFKTSIDPGTPCKLEFKLGQGLYRIKLLTRDAFKNPVETTEHILVHKPAADRFFAKLPFYLSEKKDTLEKGEVFEALWGTGYSSGPVLVEIFKDNQRLERRWTQAKSTQGQIRVPVDEKLRGGFTIMVSCVKENRLYEKSIRVQVPWSNKRLSLQWQVFRNKLQPGQKESWSLQIKGPDAEIQAAEMVATLYDVSLDQYYPHWFPSFSAIFRMDCTSIQKVFSNQGLDFSSLFDQLNSYFHYFPETHTRFPDRVKDDLFGYAYGVLFSPKHQRVSEEVAVTGGVMAEKIAPMAAPSELKETMADGRADKKKDGESKTTSVDLSSIQARKNLEETAFFYPHLQTDKKGQVTINFKIPEALTGWRFMGFAHTRNLESGSIEGRTVTQKELMVQPNPPRFLCEGDKMEFVVKVTNMTDRPAQGKLKLEFFDPRTDVSQNAKLQNQKPEKPFSIPPRESLSFSFPISVPDKLELVSFRAVGATPEFSDGEEGILPVLSRRVFVEESLPLWISGKGEKKFQFKKLLESEKSRTLVHQGLTVQMVSNPSWYAIMALPYLMEFPYECSEQVFNRLYANSLARKIANSNPRIRQVFETWKKTKTLKSNLEKNGHLKGLLLQETPWVIQAQDETRARNQVALLFDDNRLDQECQRAYSKLKAMQLDEGSWPWFPGGPGNSYITLYIFTGMGRLKHLGVDGIPRDLAEKAMGYLDGWILSEYQELARRKLLGQNHLSSTIALYLYGRSFYLGEKPIPEKAKKAVDYFRENALQHWLKLNCRQAQAHLALAFYRFGMADPARKIMRSMKERSQYDEERGRFWGELEFSWWWFRAPIETQAVMVEAFAEVMQDNKAVEECKVWLLKQKQTQDWKTTKATADAIYALLLRGEDLLASDALVEVSLGGKPIPIEKAEAGTGFYEKRYSTDAVASSMGNISLLKKDPGIAWGGVHWQYLEDISKITPAVESPLKLKKTLFIRRHTAKGPVIEPLSRSLEVGDLIMVRIELRTDRDMEYVHMKDHRASGLEPENVLSGYKFQDGLAYYEATGDTATNFFIDYLPKGTYVFEYPLRVVNRGSFQNGMARIQCMYAPEFSSHSESVKIEVK